MVQNLKSKLFRVAVAGPTRDGREIKEQWLIDIAETYNTETYTASIWPEHIRGLFPGSAFSSKSQVLDIELEQFMVAGEKRTALYAAIKPSPALIEMTQRGEKLFTSIELVPNFANTGKAYMLTLAVTDEPASLGNEQLVELIQRIGMFTDVAKEMFKTQGQEIRLLTQQNNTLNNAFGGL